MLDETNDLKVLSGVSIEGLRLDEIIEKFSQIWLANGRKNYSLNFLIVELKYTQRDAKTLEKIRRKLDCQ